jgi:predicted transcriptional regulator
MAIITVSLSDERVAKLKELAQQSGLTPEELLQASVEEWLGKQKLDFDQAAAYVLEKNAELYKRLAKCDS